MSNSFVINNSGNNEWYTPPEYIELVRRVLGKIDLDPASCEYANKIVKAKQYYNIANDGLKHEWIGNVWMNPPYSKAMIGQFVDHFVEEYCVGHILQGIVLVNNATDTVWFSKLSEAASAIVFPKGRIKFISISREKNTPFKGKLLYILVGQFMYSLRLLKA